MSTFDWVLVGVIIGLLLCACAIFGLYKLGRWVEARRGVDQAEHYANAGEGDDQ